MSAWEDLCDFTLDMLKCNTKHTTIVRKQVSLVVFAVGPLLQLALVTTTVCIPSLPYIFLMMHTSHDSSSTCLHVFAPDCNRISLLLIVHHQVMQNCCLVVVRSRLNFTSSPSVDTRPQHIHFLQALAHIHFLGKPPSTPPVLLANPCILLLRSDRLHRPIRSFRD